MKGVEHLMELWIPLISEYGFPVVVTLYLLHRIEKKLDILNDSVKCLSFQADTKIKTKASS
jgi:hypothetical protein